MEAERLRCCLGASTRPARRSSKWSSLNLDTSKHWVVGSHEFHTHRIIHRRELWSLEVPNECHVLCQKGHGHSRWIKTKSVIWKSKRMDWQRRSMLDHSYLCHWSKINEMIDDVQDCKLDVVPHVHNIQAKYYQEFAIDLATVLWLANEAKCWCCGSH
jgi:hypothetical protein